MYTGLMPIDMRNASRALYFVFEPTVGAPVDEITIWLNGGPGRCRNPDSPTQAYVQLQVAALSRASSKKMVGSFGLGGNTLPQLTRMLGSISQMFYGKHSTLIKDLPVFSVLCETSTDL